MLLWLLKPKRSQFSLHDSSPLHRLTKRELPPLLFQQFAQFEPKNWSRFTGTNFALTCFWLSSLPVKSTTTTAIDRFCLPFPPNLLRSGAGASFFGNKRGILKMSGVEGEESAKKEDNALTEMETQNEFQEEKKKLLEEEKEKEMEERIGPPPEKPLPGDCCGQGCDVCVWDTYWEELDRYNKLRKKTEKSS